MIRLGTVVLGVGDVDRAVSFWSRALGYESVDFTDSDNGFTILMPPSGEGTRVALQRADTPPQEHPGVHLDLVVEDAAEQEEEIRRLVGLGATRVTGICTPRTQTSSCLPIRTAIGSASSTPAMADLGQAEAQRRGPQSGGRAASQLDRFQGK